MSGAPVDETLQAAIDAALDEARLREKALNMACAQFKKINWTGDAKRIVAMADAFHDYIRRGSR